MLQPRAEGIHVACDHPQLVTASLDEDPDAFDTEGVEAAEESSGAVDDIADLLGKLEVAAVPTRPLVESWSVHSTFQSYGKLMCSAQMTRPFMLGARRVKSATSRACPLRVPKFVNYSASWTMLP